MKFGVTLSSLAATADTTNLVDRAIELGSQAERLGLDSVWFTQLLSYDAVAVASAVGRAIPRISVGTAVVPIYPRHPQLLASAAKTAQAPTDGRFQLGIGLGANTGIGFETAQVLAARGATVVLAVRDTDKDRQAAARIADATPGADVTVQHLDLTSLDSVRAAADALRAKYPRIDLLINNAGVMYTPKTTTRDGFELQLGTNHLGALPTLRAATDPGVRGGEYYGPDGFCEGRGHPVRVESSKKSHDADLQHRLWEVSKQVTGVSFPV